MWVFVRDNMAPHITNWRALDPADIILGAPRSNSHRGFSMKIAVAKDDGQQTDMYHQTPVMRLPFGISVHEGDYGKKYEATMAFPGYVYDAASPAQSAFPDSEMQAYSDWLAKWDEHNLDIATENTTEWFKKKYSKEVVRELYKYQLKDSSEPEKYSKLFRTKVPFRYDEFACDVFDSNGTKIPLERLTKGSRVIALVKTSGLWFAGKGFGVSHQVEQFMLMEEETFDSCAITRPEGIPVRQDTNTASYFNMNVVDTQEPPSKIRKLMVGGEKTHM